MALAALVFALSAAGQSDAERFISGETLAIPDRASVVRAERADSQAGHGGRLHAGLSRLIDAHDRGAADLAAASGVSARLIEGDRVLVEIRYRHAGHSSNLVERFGATLRHAHGGGVTEAWLPIAALDALASDDAVARLWPARRVRPQAGSETSQGLSAGQVAPWHAAGVDGSGVKIAIIDTFDDTAGQVDDLQDSGDWPESGALSLEKIGSGSFGDLGDPHGNAVLEIAFDIAPGADYIAYDVLTLGDWIEAIDDAVGQGADVISASLGAPLDGIGDGTALSGSVAEAVEAAADDGVLYINAAGNSRQRHWGGLFESSPDPALHDWSGDGQPINYFGPGDGDAWCINDGAPLLGELFWADWEFVTDDYDLLLFEFDGESWQQIDASTAPQTGFPGQTPQEFIATTANSAFEEGCPEGSGVYGWAVERSGALDEPNLQFFSAIGLDERVAGRSLVFPADSPAAVATAALNVADSGQEPYSSQGPILAPGGELPEGDEYLKPDTASFANVDTASYGANVFNGTSAAAPHVAGMAALLIQRHPGESRAERLSRLLAISGTGSNDLGETGHDFRHGHGRMRFQLEDTLAVTQQPGDSQVGTTIGAVEVELRDDEGLVVLSGPTGEIEAAIGNDPSGGSATLSGSTSRPVDDGLAAFDDLAIDTPGAGYTLELASASIGSATTDGFDITAGAPEQLAFAVQPSDAESGQAISPAIVVQVLDGQGNLVTDDDSTEIVLTIAAGPGEATLSGGGPVTVSGGEATFDEASIDIADSGYQLQAADSAGALEPDTSTAFAIHPGPAAGLAFGVQPVNTPVDQPVTPPIVVNVVDEAGNVVPDENTALVELAIETGPGGAALSGGGPVAVSNGEAVFDSVSIDQVGAGYRLEASETLGSLGSATSTTFDILAGNPAALAFLVQPSDGDVDTPIEPTVRVEVLDAEGNRVTWDNTTQVQLSLDNGPATALSGNGPKTVIEGIATFPDLAVDTPGTGYQLQAADSQAELTPDTSTPFEIYIDDIFADRFQAKDGEQP